MVFTQAEKETYSESEDLLKQYEQISEKAKMTAHEIKNHVSVIDLYTKILEKRLENVELEQESKKSVENSIESIKQAAFTISSFISELRSYSSPILTEVKLASIVNSVVSLAMPKAQEKGIALESYVDDEFRVHIDETKMQSVILNLIYNAIDAIEKNGRVTLKIKGKENNYVKLAISDSGSGISPEVLPHIFEDGFTTKIDGNGLGLGICKKLTEEQYGKLRLVKTDAEGTEFELLIPTI